MSGAATQKASTFTTFEGHRRIATGSLQANALALKHALESGAQDPVLVFSDSTGRTIDLDTSGTDNAVLARTAERVAQLPEAAAPADGETDATDAPERRGRGRPRLGVVSREVTLLPRHWEWLSAQPGGASVALRKLVEQARRDNADKDSSRRASERAYHFIAAMAGDFPGFEEATRALFAGDLAGFAQRMAAWPADVRDYALWLVNENA
ncbi:DUF2239 family protein [Cupriavidus necator]|uniref:DUF2239 family protein n=1 Tax=Cupriavidus necator TaxID=106590 RepID=UPI00339D97A5